jgi:hypothetical protein
MSSMFNSVYVRLAGGLGNQLFQLAAGMVCAQFSGRQLVPVVDALGQYDRPQEATSLRVVSSPLMLPPTCLSPIMAWSVARARIGRWMPWTGVNDDNFNAVLEQVSKRARFQVLDGYFQQCWTQDLFGKAVSMMTVAGGILAARQDYDCIVHVRGTDFLAFQSHGFLGPNYYVNAVAQAARMGLQRFGIVTDDQSHGAFIAQHINEAHQAVVVDVLPEASDVLTDFHIVRNAPARIMGNSTFAWWAAALDVKSAPTWSSSQFIRGRPRNFFLPHEIPLDEQGLPRVNLI